MSLHPMCLKEPLSMACGRHDCKLQQVKVIIVCTTVHRSGCRLQTGEANGTAAAIVQLPLILIIIRKYTSTGSGPCPLWTPKTPNLRWWLSIVISFFFTNIRECVFVYGCPTYRTTTSISICHSLLVSEQLAVQMRGLWSALDTAWLTNSIREAHYLWWIL